MCTVLEHPDIVVCELQVCTVVAWTSLTSGQGCRHYLQYIISVIRQWSGRCHCVGIFATECHLVYVMVMNTISAYLMNEPKMQQSNGWTADRTVMGAVQKCSKTFCLMGTVSAGQPLCRRSLPRMWCGCVSTWSLIPNQGTYVGYMNMQQDALGSDEEWSLSEGQPVACGPIQLF